MKRLLIANRAEIACRIHRAAQSLGIETIGVHSEFDTSSLHVRTIGPSIFLGPSAAASSYLNIPRIVELAKRKGCDAVHPGYGFLAENAEFAQAVIDAGMKFVGPSPKAIDSLGNKVQARLIAKDADVPMLPGTSGGLDNEALIAEALEVGFPLIIKAAAGGGGRGMRVVNSEAELRELLPLARSEALKFFANEDVYCERFLPSPRHVEVQILGDGQGNVAHFGTRDCSVQRRHQKLVEEAPAPGLSERCLEGLTSSAVKLAEALKYESAGTVEFLVQGDEFYFLEVNTRIQVEHPVTELITGQDLVAWQLRIAQGESIKGLQEKVNLCGHAIEFRLVAEDPQNDFAPDSGVIRGIHYSKHFDRIDFGYEVGDSVGLFYDSLLAKLMVFAPTRGEALERALLALRGSSVSGIKTNLDFHKWLLLQDDFLKANLSIRFLGDAFGESWAEEVQLSEVPSREHAEPVGEFPLVQTYRVTGKSEFDVEVIHQAAGVFLAKPKDKKGKALSRDYWRRSNCLESLLLEMREIVGS